jgi:uncharacterized protein YecE (DUF72 family)
MPSRLALPNLPSVRIGISGWSYPPWRKVFYPEGLRQRDELAYASRAFSTIEINGSFYSLMRPESYRAWHDAVPEDFVFSVKGGRYITHMKRLRDVRGALANFFASGLLCLGRKLGPILWQLPPQLRFDVDALRAFFELLPRSTRDVERLAREHDSRLNGRSVVEATAEPMPVRHTLEVRHPSFVDARYIELLREHGVASCVADSAGLYPLIEDLTADFAYARLHGHERLYTSGYSSKDLQPWVARARAWASGGDAAGAQLVGRKRPERDTTPRSVFVYFDNDVKVRAPFDARNLERLLAGKRAIRGPVSLLGMTEEPRTSWPAWRGAAGR